MILTALVPATDTGVLASDNDGTPGALIELAAAGRSLAATDVCGVAEVVTPEVGLLARPRDPAPLGKAITRLAAAPGERSSMGQRGREHVAVRYSVLQARWACA